MPFESDFTDQKAVNSEDSKASPKDRKLGDEWVHWDGTSEGEINEPKGRFIVLTALVWLLFTLLVVLGGYLVEPRLSQWPVTVQVVVRLLFLTLLGGGLIFYGMIVVAVLTEKLPVLPYRWGERTLLWLLPKATWIGGKFGISKDRIGNSFVKANNALTRSHAKHINRGRLLILLPRCLNKDTRQEIRTLLAGHTYGVATVGGGEEARKAIRDEHPSFIIAVACERDLISGIRDVALYIPVIGIPNKRPEGPCKNTYIDLEEFRQALHFFENSDFQQPTQAIATH